jgi:hypothetical protein
MLKSTAFVLLLFAAPATAQTWGEEAALTAPAPAVDDNFGRSVSIHGSTAVVGSPGDDQLGLNMGAAHVFVRNGTTWTQQAVLLPSNPGINSQFGRAVAVDGDTILVGSPQDDQPSFNWTGSVYVFVRSGTTWSEQAYLPGFANAGTQFGATLALDDDFAVIGTLENRYEMYKRTGTSWASVQEESMNSFGVSIALAIADDLLFAGSPSTGFTGQIEWYERQGSNWAFKGNLDSGNPNVSAGFGTSLAASGDTLVVGEPDFWLSQPLMNAGQAHVFTYAAGTWTRTATLTSSDPKQGEKFGRSVAVEGDLIAVGAHFDKGTGTVSGGAVHLFTGHGSTWEPIGQLTKQTPVAADRLGVSLDLSGGRVIAGAIGDDPGGVSNAGGAYVFVQSSAPTTYCTAGTSASGCRAAISANGTASATATEGFFTVATGVEGDKNGLFLYGTGTPTANPWGSGTSLRCFAPPVSRGSLGAGQGDAGTCDGWFVEDLNARWCPTCPRPQHNPGAGNTVRGQLWYRDPFNTSNQPTGFSDAFEAVVAP